MPTYDYVCDACDHKFEHFQGINDPVLKKCPECKKQKLRRLFGTGGAIMFKGSGFYITDYRSDSYKKAAEADKGGGKPDTSKSDTGKSESGKSEPAKAETKAKSDAPAKSESKSEAKSQSTSKGKKSKDA